MDSTIYIHIPWCRSKCWYCDFASYADASPPEDAYVDALFAELDARAGEMRGAAPSVYIGGGTPSLFSPRAIGRLIDGVRARVDVANDAEITLEANPGSAHAESFAGFAAAGVNRVSIGAQSLDAAVLARLGRRHAPEEVPRAVEAARAAGFSNISVDIMYGLPDRDAGALLQELDAFVALGTPHLSAYCLTVYEDTEFARLLEKGKREEMDADIAADEFRIVRDRLLSAGLADYEIANFARPGYESRHNTHYWRRGAYLGLGCGAASFGYTPDAPHGVRSVNDRDPAAYMRRVAEGGTAFAETETLTEAQALSEALFLGLRRRVGVDLALISRALGADVGERFAAEFDELVAGGFLSREGDRVRLTDAGVFVSDEIFSRFV
ncbi:radical SAM family heme chaperone HemW [bacterium]|nr:radical SAM family heme chaperone HemW [bacterium]